MNCLIILWNSNIKFSDIKNKYGTNFNFMDKNHDCDHFMEDVKAKI